MSFERIVPGPGLQNIIECFWIIENNDPTPLQQKIIPDGFTEIIFHFGHNYRIKQGRRWQVQPKNLLAGQVRKHFMLENIGTSNILGIKFKPAALAHLYKLNMSLVTDRVADLCKVLEQPSLLLRAANEGKNHYERISSLRAYFKNMDAIKNPERTPVDQAVDLVFAHNGMVTSTELCDVAGVGERQLENLFKRFIGLSPKFFCRVIRFNYIFELVDKNEQSWTSLAYEAAYYDQSHFIRNFKDFTGESPSSYLFDEKNLANFFLKKSLG
jgi:AraC-like DNA-binding protein